MKHWQFGVDNGMRPLFTLRRAPKIIRYFADVENEDFINLELRIIIDEELGKMNLDPLSEEEIEELNVVLETKKWLLK